jgi:hypothetical protein
MTRTQKLDHAARLVAIEAAARALVDKLHLIHDDERYKSVWTIAQLHCGPYGGPSYAVELHKLSGLLGKSPEPIREYNGGDTPLI